MGRETPTPDEVRAQLDRILASETFATATRLRRFLRYVVERSLAGEHEQLKEYVVGVEVFDRDDAYDPRIDAIVRVEAGRLRAKLDDYEQGAGAADAVRIRIPRGSYAPVFERRQIEVALPAVPAATAPHRARLTAGRSAFLVAAIVIAALLAGGARWIDKRGQSDVPPVRIAVLPFASFSPDSADRMLAARLTDGVTSELARIGGIGVISRTTADRMADGQRSVREIAHALNVDFVVEGRVETNGSLVQVDARVVDGLLDLKSGGQRIDGRRDDLGALQHNVAVAIKTAAEQRQAMRSPRQQGVAPVTTSGGGR
jgi:TolB-like protein